MVKTVRFVASDHCASCEGGGAGEQQLAAPTTPVSMVQTLVPHLPGLDKDKIYVISGGKQIKLCLETHFKRYSLIEKRD